MRIARVFPRKTNMSPTDEDCYFGPPHLWTPKYDQVHISVCFTWDVPKIWPLVGSWHKHTKKIRIGGPALGSRANGFKVGLYLKPGVTITSRGCPYNCPWCFVPDREGKIRELPVQPGHIVQDNNLLACSKEHISKVFEMLRTQKGIKFSGGLQARRITDSVVQQLRTLRVAEIWVSYDHPNQYRATQTAVEKLRRYFRRDQVRCYVLIGFENDTLQKAENRLREAWEMGTLPFAMRYRTAEPKWQGTYFYSDREWNLLTRRWSRPAIIKSSMKAKWLIA